MKIFNCVIVLILMFVFNNPDTLLHILIFMGQAHFALAYFYQYKAGKINRTYLRKFILFSIVLLTYYFAFLNNTHLMIFTSVLFVLHFIFDEYYLDAKSLNLSEIYKVLPITLAYITFIFNSIPGILIIKSVSVGIFVYYIIRLILNRKLYKQNDTYLIVYNIMVVSSMFGNWFNIKQNYMFFIVVLHYLNWYTYTFERYKLNKPAINKYIVHVVLFNGLSVLLFILFNKIPSAKPALGVLFNPTPFYLWTLMHLFVTFRINDIENLKLKVN